SQQYFLARVGELGAIWNGTTEKERVNYFFTLPEYNLQPGLKFLSDCIRKPLFDSVELNKEREVVIGEMDRDEAQPFSKFNDVQDDSVWWKYPSRKNPLGNRQTVLTATREKMFYIKNKYYIPNNAALCIAGDLEVDSALAWAKEYFGDWKSGKDPFKEDPIPEHPPIPRKELVKVAAPGIPYVISRYEFQGPSIGKDDKATYTADVFFDMLSRPTSRLQRRLVDSGYAQAISEFYLTQRHTGPITITMQTRPEQFNAALNILQDEMSHWDDPDYFTDAELANAKESFRLRDIYDQQSTSNYIHIISWWWASASVDYYLNYTKNIQTVTKKDIAEFVDKYLKGKNYVLGVSSSQDILNTLHTYPPQILQW
ncbi:MAG TPA: pitrilysin family protein, partial [Candidatus Kapabacteria bacterium]|nr:pitrilysin family protein [Candidatus Kapabacteria bacterium]